ncbi:DNA translocase FtsK, partial [Vibrio sp. 10N.222.55.E8]
GECAIQLFTSVVNKIRRQDQELIEPELKESADRALPAIENYADVTEEKKEVEQEQWDPAMSFSATNESSDAAVDVLDNGHEPSKRQYNIHMPVDTQVMQDVLVQPEPELEPERVADPMPRAPIYHAPEETLQEGVERSKQLNATI